MNLYRPVGLEELSLIYESSLCAFPPRLTSQPIFYPVLDLDYAREIAREWNTRAASLAGYVVRFVVDDAWVANFSVNTVGSRRHQELWIPAEDLDAFNHHIQGSIRVVDAYFDEKFTGYLPEKFGLKHRNAREQFVALNGIFDYNFMDFHGEITANSKAIFLHFPYWRKSTGSDLGVSESARAKLLNEIGRTWANAFPQIPLEPSDFESDGE